MAIRMYKYSYLTLIFTTFVFMTGSIYGVDIKLFLASLAGFSLLLILYEQKINVNKSNLVLLIICLVVYFFAALIGTLNGFAKTYVLGELIGFLSPLLIIILYRREIISFTLLKTTMLYGAITYSISKITVAILISIGFLNFTDFFNTVETVFNYRLVSMLISQEYNIVRIYIVNDLLIAFTPLILFSANKIIKSKYLITFIYVILLLNMLLCYSRFLLVIFILVSCLSFVSLSKFSINKIIISLFSFGGLLVYLVSNGLPESIKNRFSTTNVNNISSDNIRNEQFEAIVKMISDNLILGAGLGSYSKQYIRSEYVYELQWLSMIFKFGIPVFIIFFILIVLYIRNNFVINHKSIFLIILLFSSGLFNPYLQSTVMGVAILMIYSEYYRKEGLENSILRSN